LHGIVAKGIEEADKHDPQQLDSFFILLVQIDAVHVDDIHDEIEQVDKGT
jgi:hypothetical protein